MIEFAYFIGIKKKFVKINIYIYIYKYPFLRARVIHPKNKNTFMVEYEYL